MASWERRLSVSERAQSNVGNSQGAAKDSHARQTLTQMADELDAEADLIEADERNAKH